MKKSAFAATVAIMALALSACTGSGGPTTTPGGSDPAPTPAELRFSLWDENQMPAMQALVDAFVAQHSHITIQLELVAFDQYWTKLETGATGKSAPDVFWTAPAYYQRYAAHGIHADLNPLIQQDGVSLDGIYPVLIDGFTFRGGLWAMPKDIDAIGLWYNKELFDEAGLSYPDETWTWETLKDAAAKLTNPAAGVWGIAAQGGDGQDRQSYYSTIPQAGGEILTADGKSGYNTPEAIQGIQLWVDLIEAGHSPTVQQMVDTGAMNLFMTGKVAMLYDGSWRSSLFAGDSYAGERVDVALLPQGVAGRQTSVNGLGYAMYSETKHPEAAWEFIKFLGSPEASRIQANAGTVIPAHAAEAATWVNSTPQFNLQSFIDGAMEHGSFLPVTLESAIWRNGVKPIFQRAYLGEISVQEAAQQSAELMNAALEKENG